MTFFFRLALLFGLLSIYTIKPFINLIILSGFLAYLFKPLDQMVSKFFPNRDVSVFFVTTIITLIALVSFVFSLSLLQAAITDASVFFNENLPKLDSYTQKYESMLANRGIDTKETFVNLISSLLADTQTFVLNLILGVPSLLLTYILLVFLTYYFMRDGETLIMRIISLFPCKRRETISLFILQMDKLSKGIIFGHFAASLLIGFVSFLGYVLIGYGSPLLFAFFTTIVALFPIVGGAIVPFFISISRLIAGDYTIGVLMMGLSLSLTVISQFAYAWISQKTETLHPALLLLGMISGPFVFGPVGFFIGPIILGTLINALHSYNILQEKECSVEHHF